MPQYRDEIKAIWQNSKHPLADLWEWAKEPDDPERRAERWDALADWAGSHKRQQDHDTDEWRAWRKRQRVYKARAAANRDQAEPDVPGIETGGWHPEATRNQVKAALSWSDRGEPKGLLHTTEGYGLPTYSNSQPHFTILPESGNLWQHVPILGGSYSLENRAGGVETNRDNVIQIEIIAFAARTPQLSEQALDNIADLMRWVEKHHGVPRKSSVDFIPSASGASRLSGPAFDAYSGWLGHQHAAEQSHWDPGGINIAKLLA